ncbi:hypothetical protein [Pseudomonas sp. WS 5071]|uniref:hypothetical protein n=1 Tax=Pseudomonas sp. WS 5071 TaxID=2717479 RepID=UPI001472E2D0|nr:hypothetical protein [Pseudomonas sp. WS 5071]NMY74158.1 hypothetical protein [Pseudomonas sp. WS 5071]GLX90672.1 hypothetical protein Pfra02_32400 [Pseudomonas fragi]
MRSNHDIAIGMLDGYIESMIDPQCSAIAVRASANTATLIFRSLGVITDKEDSHYTERLRRAYERREGRTS